MSIKVTFIQPSEPFGAMADIPSSIIGLAAITRDAGMDSKILDARLDNWSVSETIRHLERDLPDVVAITGLSNPYRFIKNFCFELKRRHPSIPIIAGGTFIMFQPEVILPRVPIDVACTGEGDEIIVELIYRVVNKISLDGLWNVAYLKDGAIVKSEIRLVMDLDAFPDPAYDLLDMERYLVNNITSVDDFYFALPSGRGCPHHCYYCGRPYQKVRRPSPERLLSLMDKVSSKYGATKFLFNDDGALSPREWILTLCTLLEDSNKGYNFAVAGCPEQVDDEVIQRLKRAGCTSIGLGVEHLSPEIQKGFFRTIHSKNILKAFNIFKNNGLHSIGFNLLWGHPKDTIKSFREAYCKAIELVDDYSMSQFSIAALVIFPNSQLQKDALEMGKITDFEDYMYACGGYSPYVNMTNEHDDEFRSFIVERRLMNSLNLVTDELNLLLLEKNIDINRLTEVQNRLENISKSILILRMILNLPPLDREPHRNILESIFNVEMYNKGRNYYRDLGCIPRLIDLPAKSRIAVYHTGSFLNDALIRLFATIQQAGLELVAFLDFVPPSREYEGYPCFHPDNLGNIDADYLVFPEEAPGILLLNITCKTQKPDLIALPIKNAELIQPFWGKGPLVTQYFPSKYWKAQLEPSGVVRRFKMPEL